MNTLYYGDNLPILREYLSADSVDLIYLDPPFNSNRSYNVLFKDESGCAAPAQLRAFDDTWHWNIDAERVYEELVTRAGSRVSSLIVALRQTVGANPMMAYLVNMTIRLVELHRVLKPMGSLYLHCDPTASHYLRLILDSIFGSTHFLNEIIWKRTTAKSQSFKRFPNNHDTLLVYAKSVNHTFNRQFIPHSDERIRQHYYNVEPETGRHYSLGDLTAAGVRHGSSGEDWRGISVKAKDNHWKYTIENLEALDQQGRIYWPSKPGGMPRLKRYLDQQEGVQIDTVWTDLPPINSQAKEGLGYPTQKPLALLERILQASSNPGDLILDPFCGCGTTVAAAQKLDRRWIGIDITHLAIAVMKYRIKAQFGLSEKQDYQIIGEPEDLPSARQLALEDRYQFQWWALSLIAARPLDGESGSKKGKKGSDQGVDGDIAFIDAPGKPQRAIVQVKSGKVKSGDLRDLRGVMDRENAALGVFITLEPPSRDMTAEAASAGFYHSPGWGRDYPRLQILTIETLLQGAQVAMPPASLLFGSHAGVAVGDAHRQQGLL